LARETQIPKDTLYGWRVGALGIRANLRVKELKKL